MKKILSVMAIVLVALTACKKDEPKPTVTVPVQDELFCITALDNGLTVAMDKKVSDDVLPPAVSLQYSLDGTTWSDFVIGQSSINLSNYGDKVYFKAKNVNTAFACTASDDENVSANYFTMSKQARVSGNIMYLLNGDNPSGAQMGDYAFAGLFFENENIVDASRLVLPATTLTKGAYTLMFKDCELLTYAPALPATTLAPRCYQSMFEGCEILKSMPALPATTLQELCYQGMFAGCSRFKTASALPATTLATGCYWGMFNGCSQLMNAPALPATTLADHCYTGMFWDCTSLTQAPSLPATTVNNYSYNGMFWGCTSLTQAPDIMATQLNNNSCSGMFQGCTSLVNGPVLHTATLSEQCYRIMFRGCTSLTSLTCVATDLSASDCLLNWMEDINTAGTLYAMPGTNWEGKIPSSWTVEYLNR